MQQQVIVVMAKDPQRIDPDNNVTLALLFGRIGQLQLDSDTARRVAGNLAEYLIFVQCLPGNPTGIRHMYDWRNIRNGPTWFP